MSVGLAIELPKRGEMSVCVQAGGWVLLCCTTLPLHTELLCVFVSQPGGGKRK